MFVEAATTRRTTATLTSTTQVNTETTKRLVVHRCEHPPWMTVTKVLAPAHEQAIDVSNDHGRDGGRRDGGQCIFSEVRWESLGVVG